MFATDPEGTQKYFESMESEATPQMKDIESNSGEPIRYYVYSLKD
jgi:hypothetical protein